MSTHFDARIKDLLVSEAIASEETASGFYSGASTKEIQILREDGQAVPTTAGKFFFLNKKADGSVMTSDIIDGAKIKSVTKTSPVTYVPEYNYFTVDTANCSIGDEATIFMKNTGVSPSQMDAKLENITYTLASTTVLTVADGIALQLFRNLGERWYFNNRPQIVHNKAGYAAVYTTQAVALADKDNRTNADLIWILADALPYTVIDKTEATFAAFASEKVSWTSELTAETPTAVMVSDPKFYNVVITTAGAVYIVAKPLDYVVDKFAGEASKTYVGATVLDPVAPDNDSVVIDWGVTRVGEAFNPTSGKRLSALEAHLDKKTRQYGSYNYKEFKFIPSIVEATDYYTVTIVYDEADKTRRMTANPQESTIIVACDASADADTLVAAINLTINGAAAAALTLADLPDIALGDLSDVVITDAADGDLLTSDGTNWVDEVPAG